MVHTSKTLYPKCIKKVEMIITNENMFHVTNGNAIVDKETWCYS